VAKAKSIVWKSWNAMSDQFLMSLAADLNMIEEAVGAMDEDVGGEIIPFAFKNTGVIQTPVGVFSTDSMFKPSDRWDCWIGTANFDITQEIKDKILEIDGVACLKIMDRYTFFVGVPDLQFSFNDVRQEIENQLCVYTEQEVMTDEVKATVDLVKKQLENQKYWSILVRVNGNLDYVVSDELDQKYMERLNKLVELKQSHGGIILRGKNG
jgi:hypothetical protein